MTEDIFKDASLKREALIKQFEELPETTISGVVGANGPGAGKVPPEKLWSLHLSLIAWRELSGCLNYSELVISKSVTDDELQDIQNSVNSESLVRFKVKLSKNSPFGDSRAQLISVLTPCEDEELEEVLIKYKQPIKTIHPIFGELILDKSIDWFEGNITWLGKPIRISVSLDDSGSPDSSFNTAKSLYEDMAGWSKKINDYAISQLLELKNENWLGDDEEEVNSSQFLQAMKLESITVYPDGEFEFWHDNGELFWGHSILISGSITEGPNDADIPG